MVKNDRRSQARLSLPDRAIRVAPRPTMPLHCVDCIAEIIEFFPANVSSRPSATKQFSGATKPFSAFGADIRKQPMVIKLANETAGNAGTRTGDSQMRTISFILAFAFVLAGPSMAGSSETVCRASAPSPITARRSRCRLPRPIVVAAS